MSDLLQEAVDYFQSQRGYQRLFLQMRNKYQSLGRIGGTVQLTNLTQEEKVALGQFFGKDYSRQKSARIHLEKFVESLARTKFGELSFLKLLECYFGEEILTREEQERAFQREWESFFTNLIGKYPHPRPHKWLLSLLGREGNGYQLVLRLFRDDRASLTKYLQDVCLALQMLPGDERKRERLPIFASLVTRDPHGLDQKRDTGRLFLSALQELFTDSRPTSSEETNELLLKAGIIKDDISSYVITHGLVGWKGDQKHPLWQGAYTAGEMLQLTLRNLLQVDRVYSPWQKVFIVENPAVFSEILDYFSDRKQIPLICSNGQFRLAVLILLDLLVESGAEIYYSGDFDPEGLGMAQRLMERYPGKVSLWHYSLTDYQQALSKQTLSRRRLTQLENIHVSALGEVKETMLEIQRAGYQEHLVKVMIGDLIGK